jgi:hypothetical protein
MHLTVRIIAATALVIIAFAGLALVGTADHTPEFHAAILHNLQATIRPAATPHLAAPAPTDSRPCEITTADGRKFDCAHSLATGKPAPASAP